MKKVIVVSVALLMYVSSAFCVDFSPAVMELSAPSAVQYDFDGTELTIPVTVSGTPATLAFMVFTKDQAETIGGPIRNGFLGWHYVNTVDTCIYYTSDYGTVSPGSTEIVWDGTDQDGGMVPAGEYTYYVYGVDTQSIKTLAIRHIRSHRTMNHDHFQTVDEDGNVLSPPIFYSNLNIDEVECHVKWTMGSDPEDETLFESTNTDVTLSTHDSRGQMYPQEDNHSFFFNNWESEEGFHTLGKYEWVPNGQAILQTDWGEDGLFSFALVGAYPHHHGWWEWAMIGDYGFMQNQDYIGGEPESEIVYVDLTDGTEITRVDLSDWWINYDDFEAGGPSPNGGPNLITRGEDDIFYLYGHADCHMQAIDPARTDFAGGHVDDITVFINGNGDFVGDKNFEEDSATPWVCIDYNHGNWTLRIGVDRNGFNHFTAHGVGAQSFGLMAADGTGLAYYALAGAVDWGHLQMKTLDSGSAFDGLYVDNAFAVDVETDELLGRYHVGMDSFKGVITSEVAVEEDAPAAFAVAQNSPNPFNPTTTISFTIAEAGNVAIDVFNVAGQKVGTIANEFMSSGSHSVTWDASEFSAGVYFYTVKTGDFSKTMKMTLLK